jgi:Transposase DDE domain
VEAWCSDLSLCLSIRQVAEKTNEIKAISLILKDLDLEDYVGQDTRYYISSLCLPADQIATYVRGHWGIENQLHYMLDLFWGEDSSRKRVDNAAANFGTVLRIAHYLVKTHPEKISVKRKRKKADRTDSYCEQILRINT